MKWSASKFLHDKAKKTSEKLFQQEVTSWHGTPAPLPFGLPVELIYAIIECEELAIADLLNLRYVCKSFAELVAPRVFSTITLDFVKNRVVRVDPPSPPSGSRSGSRSASPSRLGKRQGSRTRKVSLSSLFRSKTAEPERPPSPVYETVYPAIERLEALMKEPGMKYVCQFPRKLVILADKHRSGDDMGGLGGGPKNSEEPRKTAIAFKRFCEEYAEGLLPMLGNLNVVEYHVCNEDYMRGSDLEFTHEDPEEFRPAFGRFLLLLDGIASNIKVKAVYTITVLAEKFRVEDVIPRSSAGARLVSLSLFFRGEGERNEMTARGYRDRLDKAAKRIATVIATSPNLNKLAFMSESTVDGRAAITLDSVMQAIPEEHELKLRKLKIPWEEITMSVPAVKRLAKLEELELVRYYLTYRRDDEHAEALNKAWRTFAEVGVTLSSIKASFNGDQGMVEYLKLYGENYSDAAKLKNLQFDVPYAHDVFSTRKSADDFEDFAASFRLELPQAVFDSLDSLSLPSFRNRIKAISMMAPDAQTYLEDWDVKKLTFSSASLKHFSGLLLINDGRSIDKFMQTLKERPNLQSVNLIVVPTWWRDPKYNIDRLSTMCHVARDSWKRMGRPGLKITMEIFSYESPEEMSGATPTSARVGRWSCLELPSGVCK